MAQFLEALNAPDLGLLINKQEFAATQDMSEEIRQEVTYHGAFGSLGPVLRQVRAADESTLSFTAILLRRGAEKGLHDEQTLRKMANFEVMIRRGEGDRHVYSNCNWTRISIRSGLDQVTLDCDISCPGFTDNTDTSRSA